MSRPTKAEVLEALDRAQVVLCSACLLGYEVRYDGKSKNLPALARALEGKQVVPVCPEVAGGFGVPRPAAAFSAPGGGAEVLDGRTRVVTAAGKDVTLGFLRGARIAVEAAHAFGATVAILKERSPSCGVHEVYSGEALGEGMGVTATALRRIGVVCLTEEDLARAFGEAP